MDHILMFRERSLSWTAVMDKRTKKIVAHIVVDGVRQERYSTHVEAKKRVEWLQEVRRAGTVQAALRQQARKAATAC